MPREFAHRLRVRYVECDMQGHVFNAHYFTWFDVAHTELFRAAVGAFAQFNARGHDLVVAEARARFLAGAHFDDEVEVAVTVEALGASSMTTRHLVRRDGEVLVEGELRHVCVDAATMRKAPWPQDVREGFAPWL